MRTIAQLIAAGMFLVGQADAAPADTIVIRAGTIHTAEGDAPIVNGAIVVQDGKIIAVGGAGALIDVPAGTTTIDYGPDAVVVPGLVAVDSAYASSAPGPRTADPSLLAIDQFDPYSQIVSALRSGITTAYIAPSRGRLIAGQGAVIKTGGELGDTDTRVLSKSAGLHGSISEDARRTPGYWEPPVPATVDVGLGLDRAQLPRTTMGAVLAIEELIAFAKGDSSFAEEYGRNTGPELAKALEAGLVWRMGAETPGEVRALIDVAKRFNLPMVIDGASRAASAAGDIAASGLSVIARPRYGAAGDFGKDNTADWPSYDSIARLIGEGVPVAIASPERLGTSELRFAAALAMRGGVSEIEALKGITIHAARILGVDQRVGSIAAGKDADLVVLTGPPMSIGSSIVATIVGGEVAWSPEMAAARRQAAAMSRSGRAAGAALSSSRAVVISVDELHVGNGEVHSPGEILVRDGKIAQVAARVGRPAGAKIVRGSAAMPGMIDAYGHLGTEGGRRAFSTRFDQSRILEPGDYADRQVAKGGVTTVNLISRSLGGVTPSIAYKPAAETFDGLVIDEVAAVQMAWDSSIITQSGSNVRGQLAKAVEYTAAWKKYETDIANWTPPEEESEAEEPAKEDDEEEAAADDEEKKKSSKKKERDPAKSVTGVFEGQVVLADGSGEGPVRYRFDEAADGTITGSARAFLYDDLLTLTGQRTDYDVTLVVETPDGPIEVTLAQTFSNDPKPKEKKSKKKDDDSKDEASDEAGSKDDEEAESEDDAVKTYLRGEAKSGDTVVATVDVTQVSEEYKVAKRSVRLPVKEEKTKAPKGMPKMPSIDPDLEPLRRAMAGEAAVFVTVNRDDQILACVAAFEEAGIKPILVDASEVHQVADQIAGRVAGALVSSNRMLLTDDDGMQINRMVVLSTAGIPVAFASQAEEGAVELSLLAARAVARGLSPMAALKGLTADAAMMLAIDDRVGTLEVGKDADIVILDGSPLEVSSSIERVFVNGREID